MQPRFTECSYVIFQNNAPGGRELQSALRQIILVCFNLYHQTSRIPKEVEFCAYIVKNKYLLVFLSALSCSQASIKDIDLKALKCCSRPSIKKLLFLSSEKLHKARNHLGCTGNQQMQAATGLETQRWREYGVRCGQILCMILAFQDIPRIWEDYPTFFLQLCYALKLRIPPRQR